MSYLVVLASGHRAYREYLLRSLADRAPLWLIDAEPLTWQSAYATASTVADVFSRDSVLRAVARIAETNPIAGIVCYHEAVITHAAAAAEMLGLPGLGVAAAGRCRDKLLTRQTLTAAGVPQPLFAVAKTLDDAVALAPHIGFPQVMKPRSLGASQGVVKVRAANEVAPAWTITTSALQAGMENSGGVILESFLAGEEISIDAAVADGGYSPLVIARKLLGGEPFFEEVGHIVDADDPLYGDSAMLAMLADAHRALGVEHGITHSEVKLTEAGPVIVEVNGRIGGDLIPYVGKLASGLDVGAVAADIALGMAPSALRSRRDFAGIAFLPPPHAGTVTEIALPELAIDDALSESGVLVEVGEHVGLPPELYASRCAFVIASSDARHKVEAALAKGMSEVRVVVDPA